MGAGSGGGTVGCWEGLFLCTHTGLSVNHRLAAELPYRDWSYYVLEPASSSIEGGQGCVCTVPLTQCPLMALYTVGAQEILQSELEFGNLLFA